MAKPNRSIPTKRLPGKVVRIDSARTRSAVPAPVMEFASVRELRGGKVEIELADSGGVYWAKSGVALSALEEGDEVLVARVGKSQSYFVIARVYTAATEQRDLKLEGRHIEIEATAELSLRCGPASIRIERDGKVDVRGERLTSEARGAHRIRGGTVDIN